MPNKKNIISNSKNVQNLHKQASLKNLQKSQNDVKPKIISSDLDSSKEQNKTLHNFNTIIEGKQKVILKKLPKTVSHSLDSTEEEEASEPQDHSNSLIDEIAVAVQDNVVKNSFASYLLIKISNSFLTLLEVKSKYNLIKDPLTFKIKKLEVEQKILDLAQENISNKSIQGQKEELAQYINDTHTNNEQELEILPDLVQTQKGRFIKDSLTFRIKKLEMEQKVLALAQESISNKSTQEQRENPAHYINISRATNEQELKFLHDLVHARNTLHKNFKASFPFIPLKLSPTFVESYNNHFNAKKNEQGIQQELLKIRQTLTNKKEDDTSIPLDKLYSFFGVKTAIDIIKVRNEIEQDIQALKKNKHGFPKKKLEKWATKNAEKTLGYLINKQFTPIPNNSSNSNKKVINELKTEAIKQLETIVGKIDKTKILPKEVEASSQEIKKLKSDTEKKLLEKIEGIIGKYPNDEEKIIEYLRLTDKAAYKNHHIDSKIIQDTQSKLLELSNNSDQISRLYDNLRNTKLYITDSEYLKEVAKQEFLVKVLAYRKINRDKAKSILIEIENKERAVVPPGLNSTVDILHQGSMSHLVGELGSYKHIGQQYNKTLENFSDYFRSKYRQNSSESDTHIMPGEREEEFESLFLIEIMRNSAALLTNPMFFELANVNYAPLRTIGDCEVKQAESALKEIEKKHQKKKSTPNPHQNALKEAKAKLKTLSEQQKKQAYTKEYEFSLIHDQMPMAMKEAVTAAIYLENSFKNFLNKRLYYDYRNIIDNKEGAAILAQRDNNILFDWICFKSGITRDTLKISIKQQEKDLNSKVTHLPIPKKAKNSKVKPVDKEYHFVKSSCEFTLRKTPSQKILVTKIMKFPLKLFNELTKNWYGKEIFNKEVESAVCDIPLLPEMNKDTVLDMSIDSLPKLIFTNKMSELSLEEKDSQISNKPLDTGAKSVQGFYFNDDVNLLVKALLLNQELSISVYTDESYQITGGLVNLNTYIFNAKSWNDGKSTIGIETYIKNLKQEIDEILLRNQGFELQILIPVRLEDHEHWATTQLTVSRNGEIKALIYDSLYSNNLVNDDIIYELKKLYNKDKKNQFTFTSIKHAQITKIQQGTENVYCGGYTAHLISNLIVVPEVNKSNKLSIWGVGNNSDTQQRQNDADLINHRLPKEAHKFGKLGDNSNTRKISQLQSINREHIAMTKLNEIKSKLTPDDKIKLPQGLITLIINVDQEQILKTNTNYITDPKNFLDLLRQIPQESQYKLNFLKEASSPQSQDMIFNNIEPEQTLYILKALYDNGYIHCPKESFQGQEEISINALVPDKNLLPNGDLQNDIFDAVRDVINNHWRGECPPEIDVLFYQINELLGNTPPYNYPTS